MTSHPEQSPTLDVVATLGPASQSEELFALLASVVGRFRLNAAHLRGEELEEWLERVCGLATPLPVVIDLQGAKMRVGHIDPREGLGEVVTLRHAEQSDDARVIPVPHAALFNSVQPGERLLLNDARIELEVTSTTANTIRAAVLRDGPLSRHKGINRPEHPIPYQELSAYDREVIARASAFPCSQFAFSFVHDGSEASLLRAVTDRHLVAKIERPEAMDCLAAIDAAFDESWLCRGDLGSQVGLARLPLLQNELVQRLADLEKPVLLAGQVLEHMTRSPQPTRSEVVHLHDVACAGFGGIVLSDETAVGRHIPDVVRLIRDLPFLRDASSR